MTDHTPRTVKVEPVRALNVNGKTCHTARTAAKAYANACAYHVYYYHGPKTIKTVEQARHLAKLEGRAYRRSYPIFEKYFSDK